MILSPFYVIVTLIPVRHFAFAVIPLILFLSLLLGRGANDSIQDRQNVLERSVFSPPGFPLVGYDRT